MAFLIRQETLVDYAHLSLAQRCIMFHRSYPEAKISPSTLLRLYKAHKISYKKVKRVKPQIDLLAGRYRTLALEMLRLIDEARTKALKVIYVDEAVFTFNTFERKAWSNRGTTITVPEKSLSLGTYAITTAVSRQGGLELSTTCKRSVTREQFVDFVEALSQSQQGQPFALFLDNLRAHHSFAARDAMARLGILPIFNLPYSPQFNGIEAVFSILKGTYKRLLLKRIIRGQRLLPRQLIDKSLEALDHADIGACLQHSEKQIECLRD